MKKIITLFALAAACLALTGCPKEQVKPSKKEIAVQLYSVRADMKKDSKATIAEVGKSGYTAVEAAGFGNGKFYGMTPEEFKSVCAAAGMKVLSSHVGHGLSKGTLESGDISKDLAAWDAKIAAHKAAGAEYLVVPYLKNPATLKQLDVVCKYFNEIGKKCKAAGLKFGYHNHAHEFKTVEGKVVLDYMLQNTSPDLVFFELDVYWVKRGAADTVAYFEKYPNRFKLLHIKDEVEIGAKGIVDFNKIFTNLAKSGCEGIIVEVERYSKDKTPLQGIRESRDWLNANPNVPFSYGVK